MITENVHLEIREVEQIADFRRCLDLQREAFNLPDLEVSPLRHFIVSKNAGGFTLGAFAGDELIGFVHHLVAVREREIIGYSHMTAIAVEFQNAGVGAKLKWAQRAKALELNQKFIKWTFDPMLARNAHFNLNRLGAVIRRYVPNYYGTDYITLPGNFPAHTHLDSDRLFAEWELDSTRVAAFAGGAAEIQFDGKRVGSIKIPANWRALIESDPDRARAEQLRVRSEFQTAFADNLLCAGFERGAETSSYMLYQN